MSRLVLLILCFLITACNMAPVLVQQPSLNSTPLRSISSGGVFLLPSKVVYERVENGETFDGNAEYFKQGPRREAILSSMVGKTLSENGIHIADLNQLNADPDGTNSGLIERLEQSYPALSSSFKDKTELLPSLRQLRSVSGMELACLITLKVKAGKGAGYNPLNGGMWQGTSTSSFKVVILSLSTGEHFWRNEVYVRNLPTDEVISESIGLLFQDIKNDKRRE